MYKYLVKVIFETIVETVDGVETTRDTSVVDSYQVKYRTDAKAKPRDGSHIFLSHESKLAHPVVIIDEFGEPVLIEDPIELLNAQVTVKYNELVVDVYAEMNAVFGTMNDVSAAASAATYEAMVKRPASYVDAVLGLNTEAEVTAYASARLDGADAYGIFRLKRIAQYQAEKAAILTP